MMYGSWDMKSNRQNLLSCWTIFCPFTPLTTQKIKIFKKWEEPLEISFYICVATIMIICYNLPEIWCVRGVIVIFHFELLFTLLPPPPNSPKNYNLKKRKKCLEISLFYICVPIWSDDVQFHDRQTDGRTGKATFRGGCPT